MTNEVNEVLLNVDPDLNLYDHNFSPLDSAQNSMYYTIEQFNNFFKNNASNFFMNLNIRSFNANGELFESVLSSLTVSPKVIILTETWLTELTLENCKIDGYTGYHTIRQGRRSGGVSIFVHSSLISEKMEDLCFSNDTIESCVVNLNFRSGNIIIFAVYRPHSQSIASFNEMFFNILDSNILSGKKLLIAGDLNINLLDENENNNHEFICSLQSMQFLPVITKPTRIPNNNQMPSLLDHIWINFFATYHSGILLTDVISDHCPTFINIPSLHSDTNHKVKLSFRSHKIVNLNNFYRDLSLVDWPEIFTGSLNEKVQRFSDKLNQLYFSNFPIMTKFISVKRLNKPWLSSAILKSIKTKSKYFKMFKLGQINSYTNNVYKNLLTKVIRKAKQNYYHSSFEKCQNDVKKTWKLINTLLSSNPQKKSIKSLLVNNEINSDHSIISQEFCNYFSSIANKLDQSIPQIQNSAVENVNFNIQNSLFLKPILDHECVSIIFNLKNTSSGLNGVPVRLFKNIKTVISTPICLLINE